MRSGSSPDAKVSRRTQLASATCGSRMRGWAGARQRDDAERAWPGPQRTANSPNFSLQNREQRPERSEHGQMTFLSSGHLCGCPGWRLHTGGIKFLPTIVTGDKTQPASIRPPVRSIHRTRKGHAKKALKTGSLQRFSRQFRSSVPGEIWHRQQRLIESAASIRRSAARW